jgi:hypothetical protein
VVLINKYLLRFLNKRTFPTKLNLGKMSTNRAMLKEAIADAKAVKETAIANAKAALEEAFAPQVKSMFTAKLQEMEKENDLEEMYGKSENEKMEEAEHEKMDEAEYMDETEKMDEINLEELLAELEEEEKDVEENLYEAEGEEDDDDVSDDDIADDEDGTPIDLEDMTDEDLKSMIEDVIADMIKSGELEAGHEDMKDEMGIEDEEEVDLAELLKEIEEMEFLDEAKKKKPEEKKDEKKKEEDEDKKKMKKELDEAYSAINILKSELNEINLLNAKLLYTNKIFKSKTLNESQKVKVLSSFDKAATVSEVKLVFETLNEGIKVKSNLIKENLGSASKTTMTPNVKKPIVESNEAFLRMQKLAGII